MALAECEDCGHQVSTEAVACPNCGRPMKAAPAPEPAAAQPSPGIRPQPQPVAPTQHAAPKEKNWFQRHKVLTVILALVVLGVIGAAASNGSGNKSGSSGSPANNVSAPASPPITGKISGEFQSASGCLGCGSLVHYIRVDKVWCGWQDGQVNIHVRFRNNSVEHVTIDWHPSYVIRDGGSHGTGLTSVQSSGVDARATRVVTVQQSPDGVAAGSAIAQCEPAFEDVSSG